MENVRKHQKKSIILKSFLIMSALIAGSTSIYSQAPFPQGPGPVTSINGQPIGSVPPPAPWGGPGTLSTPPTADWMNQGTMNVMATGYDAQGVLRQIPLHICYNFNGVNYNVMVLNAWDPFTQMWNMGVDQPAYSTSYFFNGFTYNWYAPLAIGTFYFNL